MMQSSAYCNIYVGRDAGKGLIRNIDKAEKSIKIVSPFLSPSLITKLIELNRKNIDIKLITSNNIEDYKDVQNKKIYELIIQNRTTNKEAEERLKQLRNIKITLRYIVYIIATFIFSYYYLFQDIIIAWGIIPLIVALFMIKWLTRKINRTRIYTYSYSQLFPFKVYLSPYKSNQSSSFIHSKIFIIDDKIAYLGSMNFTISGLFHNHETVVWTSDSKALQNIISEFESLMYHSNQPEMDIQLWGSQIYEEPIN